MEPLLPESDAAGAAGQPIAAVDLGSNSFHMVVGRYQGGALALVDRLREPVRLAAGLDERGHLSPEAVESALGCLERFGQRLAGFPATRVRVVGTSTLRRAKGPRKFLSRARRALGFPIEVLQGAEEARLVYLAVGHDRGEAEGKRLVVDIGGGSTEIVLGDGLELLQVNCLQMGCVGFSLQFFPDGQISREAFKQAELAARLELKRAQKQIRRAAPEECVGSSGTIKAVAEILAANEWAEQGVTLEGIRRLRSELIEAGEARRVSLDGLSSDRTPVLAGGVAVLKAVFQSFKIDTMHVSRYALREGLLYDLLGRIEHHDVRDRTVEVLAARHRVDAEHGARVEMTALFLFDAVAERWHLGPESRQMLSWAARLHEVGLSVAYSGYHKHGAYLLEHGDLPGFSREDQALLSTLVRLHRRKIVPDLIDELPPFHRDAALPLVVLLRLAVRFERGRRHSEPPAVTVKPGEALLKLIAPKGWFDEHPLTHADLLREKELVAAVDFELVLQTGKPGKKR